jgi:hypothetical protein
LPVWLLTLVDDEDGVTPENQQDADKVRYCRQRYSIFIEPHLKSEKGYFRLRIAIHQFPISLRMGEGLECNLKVFELGYVLKTDDKEILVRFEGFDEEEASDLTIL